MKMNDQFRDARIPIRLLKFKDRDLATTDELILDYGQDGDETFHLYLTSSHDPSVLRDLTQLIIDNVSSEVSIDADHLTIRVEGLDDSTSKKKLSDIINFIYKRFMYPDNYGVFDISDHREDLFGADTVSSMIRISDGRVFAPVTKADSVFFANGESLAEVYGKRIKLAVNTISYRITQHESTEFEFEYPCRNFAGEIHVRLNGIYINNTDFNIDNIVLDADGNYDNGIIRLISDYNFHTGDKLDFVFFYNVVAGNESCITFDGKDIALKSVPANRLTKTSSSFTNNDKESLATSAGLYNLYNFVTEQNDDVYTVKDNEFNEDYIGIYVPATQGDILQVCNYCIFTVLTSYKKRYDVAVNYTYDITTREYEIVDAEGNELTRGLPKGRLIKLMWDGRNERFILLNTNTNQLERSTYIHKCEDDEYVVSYAELEYTYGAVITVYKNGVRLFEGLDYSIDEANERISVDFRLTKNDTIVFEALYL